MLPYTYNVIYSYNGDEESLSFNSDRILDRDLLWDSVEFEVRKLIGIDFDRNKFAVKSYNYYVNR